MDLNTLNLVGRIGKLNGVEKTKNGADVITFSLANNRGFGEYETTNWILCKAYGQPAKYIERCGVGARLAIDGELVVNTWEDDKGYHNMVYCKVKEVSNISGGSNKSGESKPVEQEYESYDEYAEF